MKDLKININKVTVDLSQISGTKDVEVTGGTELQFIQEPFVSITPLKGTSTSLNHLAHLLGLNTKDDGFFSSALRSASFGLRI